MFREIEPKLVKITMCARSVSATSMSVKVKWGYISARKPEGERSIKFFCVQFHCKPSPSRVSLEFPGLENILQVPGNRAEVGQKSRCAQGGLGYSMSLKVTWGCISAQKLESEAFKNVLLCPFYCKPTSHQELV